ncbi:MAG: DUF1611 domain-containing protein, partial [Pseudomonadota bacterium]
GASINTAALSHEEAKSYTTELEERLGLPVVDPFREGAGRLAEAMAGAYA